MYNFLRGPYEWQENQGRLYDVSLLTDRIFEHTEDDIKEKFTSPDGPNFDALKRLPCLFTYEGFDVEGYIGRISEVRVARRKSEIIYNLPNIYPKIRINEDTGFERLGIGGARSFELGRTHWAVKDIDLFEVTTRLLHDEGESRIVLSDGEMNRVWGNNYKRKKLVFLSYCAEHSRQVSQVKTKLEQHGLRCFLAHQDITPSTIWQNEIVNALNTMHIFIGFVTDDFHGGGWTDQEIGYAHQRGVFRVFVKLGDADPQGIVASEQALRTGWDNAADAIVAHLQ